MGTKYHSPSSIPVLVIPIGDEIGLPLVLHIEKIPYQERYGAFLPSYSSPLRFMASRFDGLCEISSVFSSVL